MKVNFPNQRFGGRHPISLEMGWDSVYMVLGYHGWFHPYRSRLDMSRKKVKSTNLLTIVTITSSRTPFFLSRWNSNFQGINIFRGYVRCRESLMIFCIYTPSQCSFAMMTFLESKEWCSKFESCTACRKRQWCINCLLYQKHQPDWLNEVITGYQLTIPYHGRMASNFPSWNLCNVGVLLFGKPTKTPKKTTWIWLLV